MHNQKFSLNSLLQELLVPIVRDAVKLAFREHIALSKPEPEDPDEMLSAKEAAGYLDVSLSTLYRYSCQGEINTYGSGKRIWLKKAELDQWLQKKRSKSTSSMQEEIDTLLSARKNRNCK